MFQPLLVLYFSTRIGTSNLVGNIKEIILNPSKIKTTMRPLLLLLVCSFVLQFASQAQNKQPKKVALIVAISKYADNEWGELSSKNDIALITESLVSQGFEKKNISVIQEKQATLAGIKKAIDTALIAKVQEGDIAVFHFSGHGQQMDDDNGDEGDGLDEALVPWDGPIRHTGGPEKHYRDEQFGAKLEEVRKKLGANGDFLVIIDACHSGTSTRGLAKTRGTAQIYRTPNPVKKTGERTYDESGFGISEDGAGRAPMACFFASAPTEQNTEATVDGKNSGSLSLAFYRALSKSEKDSSYRSLFETIKTEMSSLVSRQTPMAEGDLDRKIFNGKGLGKAKYYSVQSRDKADPKKIAVGFGKLFGIFEGTTVNLYKKDTRDTTNVTPIARGRVVSASEYTSDIELDRHLDDSKLLSAWVYLNEINYGDLGIKVQLRVSDPQLKSNLEGMFKNVKQATLVNEAADLYVEHGANSLSPDSIYITDASERLVWKVNKAIQPNLLQDSLVMNIGDYARARYLRRLDLQNKNYKVTIEFVPVTCISGCGTRQAKYKDLPARKATGDSLHIGFKVGEKFRLNIINHSDQKRLYYTIVDIQPDNKVNIVIPGRNDDAKDFYIPQQEKIELDRIYTVGPPTGVEMMKIIASDVPIDLRPMVTTRGAKTRSAAGQSPFEKLMQSTYNAENVKTRSIESEPIRPDAVNVETLSFMILPAAGK
jgi:metacaspase-1